MPYVDLDRRFATWTDEKRADDDLRLFEASFLGEAGWSELLKSQRVIVLAEAGSGKSRELKEQARRLVAAGEFALHATVQNVGKEGLAASLDAASRERLEEWRSSEAPGWFFIDSVDEAKLDHVRFVDALRKLGDGTGNALSRARIVISGRYTGWEFRVDLEAVKEVLPIAQRTKAGQVEPGQLLSSILKNEFKQSKETPAEEPIVVLMAPFTREQVRLFAEAQGVQNLDEFVGAIEADNLWHFAKRPLDLGWLVDYWQDHRRFGTLAEMMDGSVRARLVEENPDHASRDELDVEKSVAALQRIAATMVFARRNRIEIPDSEVKLTTSDALKLGEVLPDWSGEHRGKLLLRPAFDPASLGQLSLHNDNEGVVRGFLAARWLFARLAVNAPRSRVYPLLFGDADGAPVVLPSARETAAWLSIWDAEVAREVVRRDPSLLLTAGDPTSLSVELRREALSRAFDELASGIKRYGRLDTEVLRLFAKPEIVPALKAGWERHRGSDEVQRLILNMVVLGSLTGALDIVRDAVAAPPQDRTARVFAIRALGRVGELADLEALEARVLANPDAFDPYEIWEVLDSSYPGHMTANTVLQLLKSLAKGEKLSENFGWRGKNLIQRVRSRDDLRVLLPGLLEILGPRPKIEDPRDRDQDGLVSMVRTGAHALLEAIPPRALEPLVVDAAIRIADRYEQSGENEDFRRLLLATPERRRAGLWLAVDRLKDEPQLQRHGFTNLWQLEFVGWTAGLREEDIPWLMDDAQKGDSPLKRRLAIGAIMPLWRDGGKPPELLEQIEQAAEQAQEARLLVQGWLKPPEVTPELAEHHAEMEHLRKQRKRADQKRDKSWFDFIDQLKSDPQQLRIRPEESKPGQVDGRLFSIWELLYSVGERTGYAIDNFGPLAAVLGPDVTREATDALKQYWRDHTPTVTSSRAPDKRNLGSKLDSMGIAGISLEARADPHWARDLTPEQAITAAQLATLELNGFPHWLAQLMETWPDEVKQVLLKEIFDHVAVAPDQHGMLDRVEYSEKEIAALVAPGLLTYIAEIEPIPLQTLKKAFGIVGRALPGVKVSQDLIDQALRRFGDAPDPAVAAIYLGFVMRVAPEAGVGALTTKLNGLDFPQQKLLSESMLPAVFGDQWMRGGVDPAVLPFDVLDRLVTIAFKTIRMEDDQRHEEVFSPNDRDHAEGVRSTLFRQLIMTPGRPTLEALRRLGEAAPDQLPERRINELIFDRAATDAEHAPWSASEAHQLEEQFDAAPRTPRDLQLVALARLEELAHDLHHHRFAQGRTFKELPKEADVQRWLAWELEGAGGRAFTMEREPHVIEEKEPDLRLQSRVSDASLPLEIKVAESWTLAQLEGAITEQLAGRYLRERDKKQGVLILVYQHARPKGWADGSGKFLSFAEVVERLRALAETLGRDGDDPPRIEIAVIDVSDIARPETAPGGRDENEGDD